ncbi:TetR family transcriptional regulator [Actinomycetes bacterium KLBMP 9759]
MTRPLRADALENRRRILAAARETFIDLGPGASLDEVARRAGTGIATLYRRFPDRQVLMRAVVQDALETAAAELRSASEEESEPFAALRRYVHRAIDARVAAVIPALLDAIPEDDAELSAASREGGRLLEQLVATAQEAGTLRPDATVADVGALVVRLSRPLPGSVPRDLDIALAHRHADLLLDGLSTTAELTTPLGGPALSLAQLRAATAERD